MKPTLCIYHSDCADGFTSAWVVSKALGRDAVEFFPGSYALDTKLPAFKDRNVLFVDFSFKRPLMEEVIKQAGTVTILDHHKSAMADLEGLKGLHHIFDMKRSGARITWDYFFPGKTPPHLLLAVEDRDLWNFELRSSREAVAALFSYEYDLDTWDYLMKRPFEEMVAEGTVLERNHWKYVRSFCERYKRMITLAGYEIPACNLPENFTSDVANVLSKGYPFAACYSDTENHRVFSLRSQKDTGIDVSEVAKQFGGGGHRNAAGFRLTHAQVKEMGL